MRAGLPAVAALLVVVVSAGCGEKDPVRIGFVGSLSGRVADLGISGRNGALLAVEARNAAGGVHGRRVELVVRDDRLEERTAQQVDKELIGLGVEAIVGHMTSSMSMAAVDLINSSPAVMVSPTTTTTYLTGKDDRFFRVIATTKEYAARMADYLRNVAGVEGVSVLYDVKNSAYTESWLESFRTEFRSQGGRLLRVESFNSGQHVPFFDLVQNALVPETEALVVIASAMDTAMICQQLRKGERPVQVAAAEWAATERLIDLGGSAVEGIIISQFFDRERGDPAFTDFKNAYRDRFGEEPGFAAVNAYDAALVVMQAMEEKRRGESLKEAIVRIGTFHGVQGEVAIDRYGDAARKTFITTIRNGSFEVLE